MLRTVLPLIFAALLLAAPGVQLTQNPRLRRALGQLSLLLAGLLAAGGAVFLHRTPGLLLDTGGAWSVGNSILPALLLLPVLAGLLMLLLRQAAWRYALLLFIALLHAGLTSLLAIFFIRMPYTNKILTPSSLYGLLAPDWLGLLFLALASLLFVAASIYAVGYLRNERANTAPRKDFQDGSAFTNAPERRFLACLCFFLASMTLVTTTQHLGALWVGIELTTLSSAPLIYFHRHRRSLEATWKYLMICSVGIALAFIGNILFTLALRIVDSQGVNIADLGLSPDPWFKAGFIFLLVGYGTKMGLAPLHNWLPDAHSQAPSLVSALLSGALLNCAFLGILRGHQMLIKAGLGDFSGDLLVFFGLLSMLIAAVFIVDQGHYKRLLAYSSVEHMGILSLGVGLGGAAAYSALLHAVSHSLTKCLLFLLAGNILSHYHTHSSYDARGLRWTMPITAALWMAGFLAIAGSPPFGLFLSEFSLLKAIFDQKAWITATIYLCTLAVIFVGMSVPVLRMVQGPKPPSVGARFEETPYNVGPPLCLAALVLCLGVYIPDWLAELLRKTALSVGGLGYGM